jgi:hypothetical protein
MEQDYIKVITIHLYYKNPKNVNFAFPKLLLRMGSRRLVNCFIHESLGSAELEECAARTELRNRQNVCLETRIAVAGTQDLTRYVCSENLSQGYGIPYPNHP